MISTVLAAFGAAPAPSSVSVAGPGTIRVLQYVLLAAGVVASLHTAVRIARRHDERLDRLATVMPYLALISLFAVVNAYLFALPMSMRI